MEQPVRVRPVQDYSAVTTRIALCDELEWHAMEDVDTAGIDHEEQRNVADI